MMMMMSETRKLKGETENMGVCTKERKGVTAEVLMATPCTNSLVAFGARTIFILRERWVLLKIS